MSGDCALRGDFVLRGECDPVAFGPLPGGSMPCARTVTSRASTTWRIPFGITRVLGRVGTGREPRDHRTPGSARG